MPAEPTPQPFPGHDGGPFAPVPGEVVASWAPGHFAENLVVDPSGAVWVSLHSHDRIDRYDPGTRSVETVARLPTAVTGLAFAPDGVLWASGGRVGEVPGLIFRIGPDGTVDEWCAVDDAAFLNGVAIAPDGRTLLACESLSGRVVAVDLKLPRWWTWLADDRLRPRTDDVPGANGVTLWGRQAWVSVTQRAVVHRVALAPDGTPGELEVVAADLLADDFAFDTEGAAYLATHPANTVVRLDPDGTRVTLAGPAQGAKGATACAFGRAPGDETALYVTTTGGLGLPGVDTPEPAKLLRLEVGRRGLPLAW